MTSVRRRTAAAQHAADTTGTGDTVLDLLALGVLFEVWASDTDLDLGANDVRALVRTRHRYAAVVDAAGPGADRFIGARTWTFGRSRLTRPAPDLDLGAVSGLRRLARVLVDRAADQPDSAVEPDVDGGL